jgi:hypothetical protein
VHAAKAGTNAAGVLAAKRTKVALKAKPALLNLSGCLVSVSLGFDENAQEVTLR